MTQSITPASFDGFDENARHIATRQYLQPQDHDLHGLFSRVANAVAAAEQPSDRLKWAQKYYDLMAGKKFCGGGRIMAGAGTQHGNMLNCYVQGNTEHEAASFEGVMEIARKLALVTKVGGGNGVNLDVYPPRSVSSRSDTGVRGWAYLSATHADVHDFIEGLMRPPTQPDGDKVPMALRNFTRVVYGAAFSQEMRTLARQNGVLLVSTLPEDVLGVQDDMAGIIDAARQMADQARMGLEPRLDLSEMRPEGAPIKGSGGTSSGPVSFLTEIFDNFLEWANLGAENSGPVNTLRFVYSPVLRVVRQGGTRRGAGMATISIDHPDVLDFLTAKDLDREAAEGDISTFNISILVTEKFWQTLQQDGLWFYPEVDGRYPGANGTIKAVLGKYHFAAEQAISDYRPGELPEMQTDKNASVAVPVYSATHAHGTEGGVTDTAIPARWIWREIANHAWSTGEPGLIFVDRVNEFSAVRNLGGKYIIKSTNPCLAAGTMIRHQEMSGKLRDKKRTGIEVETPIEQLVGRTVEIFDPFTVAWYETEFRVTGKNQQVSIINFENGESVTATPYHTFFLEDKSKIEVKDLKVGDRLSGWPVHETNEQNKVLDKIERIFVVKNIEDGGIADEVYCCSVEPYHRFMLANGLVSGNCGEIPLTIGEPCDLGAINLSAYVERSIFNEAAFRADVRTCIRFLDDVLDVNVFALEDNRVASQDLRRLGLGVMGLADALIKMGLRYDSQAGRDAITDIMTALREEALAESEKLGQERSNYPVYDRHTDLITHAPRRNVAVLTVAPTGTTSMLMGVSSGIEPVFSPFIWRKIGSEYRALLAPLFVELLEQSPVANGYGKDGHWDWDKVTEAVSENHGSVVGLDFIPQALQQVFVCAHDIAPLDHVRMQGAVQRAFDAEGDAGNSLSKTVNLPNSATVQEIEDAYSEAYRTGCKGITVYRDGSRQFQVLSTSKKKEKKPEQTAEEAAAEVMGEAAWDGEERRATPPAAAFTAPKPVYARPARLTGITDMVKLTDPTTAKQRSFLVTVNCLEDKPVEVMVISGRAGDEANADSEALGRVVSIALQFGVPKEAIIKTLRGLNGGLYGSYNGRLVGSKADLIAVALETFAQDQGARLPVMAGGSGSEMPVTRSAVTQNTGSESGVSVDGMAGEKCPVCEENAVIREEGCLKCRACGYSKCG